MSKSGHGNAGASHRGRRRRCVVVSWLAGLACMLLATVLEAAPQVYVHHTDGTCGGLSPCYPNIDQGVQNVDNGGEVIVLSNGADAVLQNRGKTGLTIRGDVPTRTITGGVNITGGTTTGWEFRDLIFTAGMLVKNIATSLTIENLTTTGMQIGSFTQDTNAAIVVRNVTMGGNPQALISIISDPGVDIGGSITIEDCNDLRAINIISLVAVGDPADITANVTIARNDVSHGPRIIVNSNGPVGTGEISGTIRFEENTMSPSNGKFGVSHNGNASGPITGHVIVRDNDAAWLAVVSTNSLGGSIGQVTVERNILHAVEISSRDAPLFGPILVDDNEIVDRGLVEPVRIQVDGEPILGNVTITDTTGSAAFIAVQNFDTNGSGTWQVVDNDALRLAVDSTGGSIAGPITVSGNVLPPANAPNSSLTVRTLAGGDLGPGLISDNVLDTIQFGVDGSLAANFRTTANVVRENASFIASGAVGPGLHMVDGNDIDGPTYFDGMTTDASFNRFGGFVTRVAGAFVDATNNWWGCNEGPGEPGCESSTPSLPSDPWLVLRNQMLCTSVSSGTIAFDLLEASNGTQPAGNNTPGLVDVSTTIGTVMPASVALVGGAGQSQVDWPDATMPTVSTQLDSEVVEWSGECQELIFSDGFESGDTTLWSTSQGR